jgi:hypothetical protein
VRRVVVAKGVMIVKRRSDKGASFGREGVGQSERVGAVPNRVGSITNAQCVCRSVRDDGILEPSLASMLQRLDDVTRTGTPGFDTGCSVFSSWRASLSSSVSRLWCMWRPSNVTVSLRGDSRGAGGRVCRFLVRCRLDVGSPGGTGRMMVVSVLGEALNTHCMCVQVQTGTFSALCLVPPGCWLTSKVGDG